MRRSITHLISACSIITAGVTTSPSWGQTIVTVPKHDQPSPRHTPDQHQTPEQPATTTHERSLSDKEILSRAKHPSRRLRYTNRSYRHQVIPPHQPEQPAPVPPNPNKNP